ncbi:MAG: hypothetical protein KKB50_12360 [Planctomycetes bacterium]|nr:hypothetical protein [Planctomycetota bacterium]
MTTNDSPRRHQIGHIKDARGRRVTQLDPVTMRLLHQQDAIPYETLRELADEIGMRMPTREAVDVASGCR